MIGGLQARLFWLLVPGFLMSLLMLACLWTAHAALERRLEMDLAQDRLSRAALEMEINSLELALAAMASAKLDPEEMEERLRDSMDDFRRFENRFTLLASQLEHTQLVEIGRQLSTIQGELEQQGSELLSLNRRKVEIRSRAGSDPDAVELLASIEVEEAAGHRRLIAQSARFDDLIDEELEEAAASFEKEAEDAVRSARSTVTLTGLTSFLGILFFTVAIYGGLRRLIIHPLARIADVSRAMASGDLARRVGIDSRDEIGELSRLLDRLASDLQGSTVSLDQYRRQESELIHHQGLLHAEIRERKALEIRLQAAVTSWRSTFDSVDAGLIVLTLDGRIDRLNVSAARRAGADPVDLVGADLARLPGASPWREVQAIWQALRSREGEQQRSAVDAESGTRWLVEGTHRRSAEESVIVVVFRDITELVALQNEVRRNHVWAEMGQLTAGLAHQVRNPLFAITATIEALAADPVAEQIGEDLDALQAAASRMSRLMEGLLSLGRPNEEPWSPLSLQEVAALAKADCSAEAQRAGVAVVLHDQGEPVVARGRCRRLEIALENLVLNAIQHSPYGGRVDIEIGNGDGEVWVCVRDQGRGLGEGDHSWILEPFATGRQGGTGLGLALVQRIVEHEHQGRLGVANRSDEPQGAEFTIFLPASVDR